MVARPTLTVPLEFLDLLPEDLQILAGIAQLDLRGLALVLTHRLPSRLQARLRQLRPDGMAPIIPQLGQARAWDLAEGGGSGILRQHAGGQASIHIREMSRELRNAEIHSPMELSDTIARLLDQPIRPPDQFTEFCEDRLRDRGGGLTCLSRQPGTQHCIDAVRLRTRQIFGGQPMGPQRIEQRHGKALRDERRKEISPVMPGRLHRDLRVGGGPITARSCR